MLFAGRDTFCLATSLQANDKYSYCPEERSIRHLLQRHSEEIYSSDRRNVENCIIVHGHIKLLYHSVREHKCLILWSYCPATCFGRAAVSYQYKYEVSVSRM